MSRNTKILYKIIATLLLVTGMIVIDSCKHSPDDIITPDPIPTICDSSNVTYPGTIYPIFQSNCISCHGSTSPEAGIDLTNFEDVAIIAQNGALAGSIEHLPTYSPMPKDSPQLTECDIELIKIWISDTTFTPGGGGGIPCDPDTVYFQNTVLPLLQSSCGLAGCHDQQSAEGEVILTSYNKIMQTADVVPGEPWESDLWEKIEDDFQSDRMPPPPAPPFTPDQKDIIYDWILQGALNNYCDEEDCDSVNVTYSGTVFPVIQNNCIGCHTGPDPGGGISLSNYDNIKVAGSVVSGEYGSLLGTITHFPGNSEMPKNGNKLSDCNIAQVRKWIDDGMPDN